MNLFKYNKIYFDNFFLILTARYVHTGSILTCCLDTSNWFIFHSVTIAIDLQNIVISLASGGNT